MKVRISPVGALRALALPVTATLLLGACAGATRTGSGASTSPPEVAIHAVQSIPKLVPTPPPADLDAVKRFAWQQVVQLGEAFAAGDVAGFLAKVSRGFYRSYSVLESSLTALLTNSSDRDAVVAIGLITEEEGRVSVTAEWTRRVTLPDRRVEARHGETVFLFLKSDTSLRLIDYRGDAPFAIDGI